MAEPRLIALVHLLLALAFAPLLPGVINRVKAVFGGRVGKPLLQSYFDIWKLLHKGAVYSRTTTWAFRAGPVIGLAAMLTALLILPFGGGTALAAFPGDLFLFAYLFGLARFFTTLDTGSSFAGMGASREATFSALAEPALFIGLLVLARQADSLSLSVILGTVSSQSWTLAGPVLALVTVSLFILVLAENSRIPVDDPNTHLELTMIHEVMVLDHCGPDLGFITYGAALKLWLLGSLVVSVVSPATGSALADTAVFILGMLALAAAVGVVESVMARLRLVRVPQLLATAAAFSALALILLKR
jgi:formate hydrogenlyase subunit 4